MAENMSAENKTKKGRKWVVTGMVVFLVALALLTFFSNTIMNATIPKVMGIYGNRGNLAYTNSATGIITADQKYEVKGVEGRVVKEVLVYNYQPVSRGDVLLTLEPLTDDTSINELRTQLESLEREAAYADRRPGQVNDYTSYQEAIVMAQESLDEANQTLNDARNRDAIIAENQNVVNQVSSTIPGLQAALDAESATVSDINAQISALETRKAAIENQITTLVTIGVPTPTPLPADAPPYIYDPAVPTPTPAPQQTTERIGQLQEEIMAIDAQIEILNEQLNSANDRVNTASANLASAQAQVDEASLNIENAQNLPSVTAAQSAVNSASSALSSARRSLSEAQINDGIAADQSRDEVNARNQQIADLREQIEKAEETANQTEIVATEDGFVFGLSAIKGDILSKDIVILQIIPYDTTYSVTFKFDAQTAQNFYEGMEFTVDSYQADRCIVQGVRPDEDNPRDSRIVKCALEGDWLYPGDTITVTADRGNANYDCVVPSSAVNEDNSGTFVYIIEESSSPLGKKYIVKRVAVSVEESSGAYTAIAPSGNDNLNNYQIVVRSEKPLNDGDRVRLEDFNSNNG